MKFPKGLASTFAAAALALSLTQAAPAFGQETSPPAPASDRQASLSFDPLVPIEVLGGLGGAAAILLLLGATRRTRGTWLRAGASAAFVAALANPTLLQENREKLPTQVAIVVDKSASQALDGRDARTAQMQAELAKRLGKIEGVEVQVIEIGGARDGVPANGTSLFGGMAGSLSSIPQGRLGGIFIITDGQVHDSAKTDTEAPAHILISGRENEHDRRVVLESAPAFGIVDEQVTIRFKVVDDGIATGAGARIPVSISVGGTIRASRQVNEGETVEVKINIPLNGPNIVEIVTEAVPGELTAVNNQAVASIEGVREKMQILLISGEPYPGERVWRNLLTSDPSIELVHFTILKPPGKEDDTPLGEMALIPLPTEELFLNKLDKFDLVIFDRHQYRGILPPHYYESLARYVEKGGALLTVSGPEFAGPQSLIRTPLARIFPATPSGTLTERPYQAEISDTGRRHPVTRNLSQNNGENKWGRWFRIIDVQKPQGHIVMKGPDDKPLLILNRKAEGRIAMLLSDSSWLWARGFEGGGPYAALLQRTAHWLMREPTLEEEALRSRIENGRLVIERQTMSQTTGPVTITTPSGKTQSVTLEQEEPGLWRARLPAEELGLYRVQQDGKRSYAGAGTAAPVEFSGTISNMEILAPLAAGSGGSIARMEGDGANLAVPEIKARKEGETMHGPGWLGIRMSEATALKGNTQYPLISGFLGLGLLLGGMSLVWRREGGGLNGLRKASPQPEKPKGPDHAP